LKEVFLFARPEEKPAIERALTSVIGPMFTVLPALGRGSNGGVENGMKKDSLIGRLFSRPALSSFLPKISYYFVLHEEDVDDVLEAVHGALAAEGGPEDCGRGLAIICPIEAQHAINLEPSRQADEHEGTGESISSMNEVA